MDSDSSSTVEELVDRLVRSLVKSPFDNGNEFWPRGCIEELLTPKTISEELESRSGPMFRRAVQEDQTTLSALVDFFTQGSQTTFAIFLCCDLHGDRLWKAMQQFISLNFKDSKLPVVGEDVKRIFSSSTRGGYRNPWTGASVRSFCAYQWKTLAPVFDNRVRELALRTDDILPFTWASHRGSAGTFGEVHKVVIHPNHQGNTAHANVAIKKLHRTYSDDEETQRKLDAGWDREVGAHKAITRLNSPNIIEFISAVTRGYERYLMFEWADGGNLREFWARKPLLSSTLVRDVLVQVQGLAHALEKMHSLNYRHGDMKPENILRVETPAKGGPPRLDVGTLKICDMGLSEKHITETRLRDIGTITQFTTWRYEPPEAVEEGSTWSRRYDTWSFGCIILEFIVWLIHGVKGLDDFNQQIVDHLRKKSHYFENGRNGEVKVHSEVLGMMKMLTKDPRCRRGETALGDLLQLVSTRLLVVELGDKKPEEEVANNKHANIQDQARADSTELRKELDSIIRNGNKKQAYWLKGESNDDPPSLRTPPPIAPAHDVSHDAADSSSSADISNFGSIEGTSVTGATSVTAFMDEAVESWLLKDLVMRPFFEASVARVGLGSFCTHFERYLRQFASRVDREAETDIERKFTARLQKRAAKISNSVANVISRADTEKSAKLALAVKEPVVTETLNRFIADTTTASLSVQVETSVIEAGHDIDEENIDGADAESDDGDESTIDNVEAVKTFMMSTEAFQRLREDVCLFAFPDTRQLIRTVVDGLDIFTDDTDVATINCHMRWEVLACCEAEIEDLHDVAETATFTGNSKHAQAASCAEYLRQTWPRTGTDMMGAFYEAITKRVCEVKFSQEHGLRLKLEPTANKLDQPESASVEITGSRRNMMETLEQLAWLAATFRKPQGGSMTSSYANLARVLGPLMPTDAPPLLELSLMSPRPVTPRAGKPGNCWIPLLRESILAGGFPIATRTGGLGLETPVPLMMYLAGVHYPIDIQKQGIVLRSHIRSDSAELYILVPTQKLGETIQWHFVNANKDQISIMNEMAKSESWYQTMDLNFLMTSRAFLGCWPQAKVLVGTKEFHSRTIQESGLPTAGPEAVFVPEGNMNIGANISAEISKIWRMGVNFGINFRYKVRKGQAAITPGQLGPPQVLRNAAQQPLLLYDSEAQCAWIVPELSVALDMTHHFLADEDLADDIREKLQYAAATGDGGAAARAALDACGNEILWENGTEKIRFRHVVEMFLNFFGQRKSMAEEDLQSYKPFESFKSPRGWEYGQFRGLDPGVLMQKKANEDHKKHRSWWEITRNPTVLVLFGKGFGQVIKPDVESDCPTWSSIPCNRGLLTASMRCIEELSKNGRYTQLKHTKLQWHQHENSTLFEPCQPGRACVRIQELRKPPKIGRHDIHAPAAQDLLRREGAVVFGAFPRGPNPPCPGPQARLKTPALPLPLLMAVVIGMLSAALISRLKTSMVALSSLFGEPRVLSEGVA